MTKRDRIMLFFLLLVVVVVCIVAAVAVASARSKTPEESRSWEETETKIETEVSGLPPQEVYTEKWQEGTVEYKGKHYIYNSELQTYLLMGIDQEELMFKETDGFHGGQADAMFLLVADPEKKELTVISIHRNTMAEIELYDGDGVSMGTTIAQLCTQHGFGDGKRLSCIRMVDAVSNLFYDIPIKGYLSMHMGALSYMNDAIGGVKLTVLEDVMYPLQGVTLSEGDLVTLNGMQAYYYLRGRDTSQFDSATGRLRRQEQYINCYMQQLRDAAQGDPLKVLDVYDSIAGYMVTNIDFVPLVTELMDYEYDDRRMYTVPGETVMGEKFEEYYVDEDAFLDLIYQVFYEEVE